MMAVDELKSSTTPSFVFDWQDNAGAPQATVSIMQRQYLDPPDIYMSGVYPQTAAIWDQISAKHTPHFCWIYEVALNPKSNNNFRTWVNFKIEPELYLAYVDKHKPKRIAIVYPNVPVYVNEVQKLILPGLAKRGIKNPLVEVYDFDTSDFKPIAEKISAFKPDLIVLQGYQIHEVRLVKALRPYSVIKDGNTIANYDMMDAADILAPEEVEGIRISAPYFVTRPAQPEIRQWRLRFVAKYKRTLLYTDAFSYDMMLIINDASKRLHLPATSDQWIDALKKTNLRGITGLLKFDSDGSLITPIEFGMYHNGKLTRAEL
jgi:ABC-type branched-subunit amino acid transport system substrate-binding protein